MILPPIFGLVAMKLPKMECGFGLTKAQKLAVILISKMNLIQACLLEDVWTSVYLTSIANGTNLVVPPVKVRLLMLSSLSCQQV